MNHGNEEEYLKTEQSGETREDATDYLYRCFLDGLRESRGRITIKQLLRRCEGPGGIFILNGNEPIDCRRLRGLVVPNCKPEKIMKALRIAAECDSQGHPLASLVLMTDKLNSKIETYIDEAFRMRKYLNIGAIKRWYIRRRR